MNGEMDPNVNLLGEALITSVMTKEKTPNRLLFDIKTDSWQLVEDMKKRCCPNFFISEVIELMYARCSLIKAAELKDG